jgi:hypothetical protein
MPEAFWNLRPDVFENAEGVSEEIRRNITSEQTTPAPPQHSDHYR